MNAAVLLRRSPYTPLRIGLGMATVVVVAAASVGCHHAPSPKMNKRPAEVVVTTPVRGEVTDYQDFTGRMEALKTVDIRPRVSGYIDEAPFVEGDIVKEGDLLFQIDPRPYEAEVNQAKANLKVAQADVALENRRAMRGLELVRSNAAAIGQEEYDQIVAARDKAIANVGAMKAALESAQLRVNFTHVKVPPLRDEAGRPLVGRISRRMVDPGNLVNADQTILTTLVSIDPMYAYFDVDERTYLELAEITERESYSWFSALHFPVLMRLANEKAFRTKGFVNFLDNRLNANTGTVRMRGVFANPSGILKSGLFVRIRLPLGTPYKAFMVPDEALLSDQGRKYVYVVKDIKKTTNDEGKEVEEGTVEYRAVELGQALQGLRVIKEGIKEDERVIISGMQRVRPGVSVVTKMQKRPTAPKSSLTEILKEDIATKATNPKPAPAVPSPKDMQLLRNNKSQRGGKERR